MTEEFYSGQEEAEYQDRAAYFIDTGSSLILERWAKKPKCHYEDVLRRELDGLDDEFLPAPSWAEFPSGRSLLSPSG